MKKLLIVSAAFIALGTSAPATAADMQVKAPVYKAPPPVYVFSWAGFYIGADVGGGWSKTSLTNTISDGNISWPDLAPGQGIGYNQHGFIGGGHIGYNWQTANWVLGVEVSGFGANIKGGATTVPGDPFSAGDDVFSSRIRSLFLATARVGVAWDRALLYVRGGYAGADVRTTVSDTVGSTGAGADSNWRSGGTVGVGLEYAFTDNLIGGVEYDYVRLNSASINLGDVNAQYVFNDAGRDLSLVYGRLSYKFGGPGVARY
jgi:outer membrane immunogenic protein